MKRLVWTKELSKKFWESISGTKYLYNQNYSRLNAVDLIEMIRPYLKENGRHLDFGAGEGYTVRALIDEGYPCASHEPWGMSPQVYESLSSNPLYLGELSVNDKLKHFDAVLLIEVIEHLFDDDIHVVLSKIHSLLNEDGYLIVSTPNREDLEGASIYCPVCDHLFHPWQHMRSFSPESLSGLLHECGFESQVIHQVEFSSTFYYYEEIKKHNNYIEQIRSELGKLAKDRTLDSSQIRGLIDRIVNSSDFMAPEPFDSDSQRNKRMMLGNADRIVYIGKKRLGNYPGNNDLPAAQSKAGNGAADEKNAEKFYRQFQWIEAHKPYFMLLQEYEQLQSRIQQLEDWKHMPHVILGRKAIRLFSIIREFFLEHIMKKGAR